MTKFRILHLENDTNKMGKPAFALSISIALEHVIPFYPHILFLLSTYLFSSILMNSTLPSVGRTLV